MSNLIHLANQALEAEIIDADVLDTYESALDLIPSHQHPHLKDVVLVLAVQDDYEAIQKLIDASRTDASEAKAIALQMRSEVTALQRELREGIERLHQYHEQRHELTNQRIDRLQDEVRSRPQSININVKSDWGVPKELAFIAVLVSILALMLLHQSMNVRDSWFIHHQQQEVNQ